MRIINDTVETAGIIWRRSVSVAGRCQSIKLRFVCATNYGVPRRSSVIAGSLENKLELNNFNRLTVVLTCCKLRRNLETKTATHSTQMTCTFYIALVTALRIIFNCSYLFFLTLSVLNLTSRHHSSFLFF
jgi:hypothetical protein